MDELLILSILNIRIKIFLFNNLFLQNFYYQIKILKQLNQQNLLHLIFLNQILMKNYCHFIHNLIIFWLSFITFYNEENVMLNLKKEDSVVLIGSWNCNIHKLWTIEAKIRQKMSDALKTSCTKTFEVVENLLA